MSEHWTHRLTQVGLREGQTLLEQKRIRLLNQFALLIGVICLVLTVVVIPMGAQVAGLADLAVLILGCIPVLLWNNFGKPMVARVQFSIVLFVFSVFNSAYAIHNLDRATGPEYVLFGLGVLMTFLFDAPYRTIWFYAYILALATLEYYKVMVVRESGFSELIFSFINQAIVWTLLAVSARVFRKQYEGALYESEDLRQALSEQNEAVESKNRKLEELTKQLSTRQQVMRALVDHQPHVLLLLSPAGHFLVVNKLLTLLYQKDFRQIMGKHFSQLLDPPLFDFLNPHFHQAVLGKAAEFEGWVEVPTRGELYLQGEMQPVYRPDQTLMGVAVFIQNISTLKNKEEELYRLNDQKNHLFKLVAHELKSPLHSLRGILDFSHRTLIDPEEFYTHSQRIKDHLGRLSLALENLIMWSEVQMDKFTVDPHLVPTYPSMVQAVAFFQEMAHERDMEFDLEADQDLMLYADPRHVQLVLRNLVDNAVKYGSEGTVLVLRGWERDGFTHVAVSDHGEGMTMDHTKALEDQLKSPLKSDRFEGSSLQIGLRLCAKLIHEMGGSIDIESQYGVGTSITVSWPGNVGVYELNQT